MQTNSGKKKNIFNKLFKKKDDSEINLLSEDDDAKPEEKPDQISE
jgi:hypothetical protein